MKRVSPAYILIYGSIPEIHENERLTESNAESYLVYLKKAMSLDPDMLTIDEVDENEIRNRIIDGKCRTSSYYYLNKENGDYSDGKE